LNFHGATMTAPRERSRAGAFGVLLRARPSGAIPEHECSLGAPL